MLIGYARSANCTSKVSSLKALPDSIDTGAPSGGCFFHAMGGLAEMERELIVERTRAGLEVTRQLGRKGGRKPKMTYSENMIKA